MFFDNNRVAEYEIQDLKDGATDITPQIGQPFGNYKRGILPSHLTFLSRHLKNLAYYIWSGQKVKGF